MNTPAFHLAKKNSSLMSFMTQVSFSPCMLLMWQHKPACKNS